jgi:hypothetical protein
MKYPTQIGEIEKSFIAEDMVKIVVLKGCSKTIGIGDEAECQKCKNRYEVGVDTLGVFFHSTAPNDQVHVFSLGGGK